MKINTIDMKVDIDWLKKRANEELNIIKKLSGSTNSASEVELAAKSAAKIAFIKELLEKFNK